MDRGPNAGSPDTSQKIWENKPLNFFDRYLLKAYEGQPDNFEDLLETRRVGPKLSALGPDRVAGQRKKPVAKSPLGSALLREAKTGFPISWTVSFSVGLFILRADFKRAVSEGEKPGSKYTGERFRNLTNKFTARKKNYVWSFQIRSEELYSYLGDVIMAEPDSDNYSEADGSEGSSNSLSRLPWIAARGRTSSVAVIRTINTLAVPPELVNFIPRNKTDNFTICPGNSPRLFCNQLL